MGIAFLILILILGAVAGYYLSIFLARNFSIPM
jgi:hypothetical protein